MIAGSKDRCLTTWPLPISVCHYTILIQLDKPYPRQSRGLASQIRASRPNQNARRVWHTGRLLLLAGVSRRTGLAAREFPPIPLRASPNRSGQIRPHLL